MKVKTEALNLFTTVRVVHILRARPISYEAFSSHLAGFPSLPPSHINWHGARLTFTPHRWRSNRRIGPSFGPMVGIERRKGPHR